MKKCREYLFRFTFSAIPDQTFLRTATALLLLVGLAFFHEPMDLAYVGHMILLGAAIEYSGVWSRQWHWGGVGLFLRWLALPVLARYETRPSYASGN